MLTTTYIPATNTKPSRIRVEYVHAQSRAERRKLFVSYDHGAAEGLSGPHMLAVAAWIAKHAPEWAVGKRWLGIPCGSGSYAWTTETLAVRFDGSDEQARGIDATNTEAR